MTRKWSIVTIAVALILLTRNPALACTADPIPPGDWKVVLELITGIDVNGADIVVEIDGLTARGSQAGDSCGAAPFLPEGLVPVSLSVVHAKTGEDVGFEKFHANPRARRGFCGKSNRNCEGFVAKVGQKGIKAGTPLKMIIKAMADAPMSERTVANLAVRMALSSVLVAGGIDKNGNPHHHLTVFKPRGVIVELPDEQKKRTKKKKNY